jgi:hypothetical protein
MRKIRNLITLLFIAMVVLPAFAFASESKVHIHGYGELHFNDPRGDGFPTETASSTLDFHRLVWGVSYTFNEEWSLHTEIDFEHATKELELEFAYLEYRSNHPIGFRAGSLLLPVGPLNEYHEPPLFYSVERPYVQKFIIPTSWSAGGLGIFGESAVGLKYQLYLVEGLDASLFSGSNGIRKGRQILDSSTNNADKWGGVGRLEYTGVPGLAVGVSYYSAAAANANDVAVTLWDIDLRYKVAGLDLSFLTAKSEVKGASNLTAKEVGETQTGQYGEVAYHLNHLIKRMPDIVPFYRVEQFNTQETVPTGVTAEKENDQQVRTYGLAYYPDPNIVFKVDREDWSDAGDRKATRTNVGVGFMF